MRDMQHRGHRPHLTRQEVFRKTEIKIVPLPISGFFYSHNGWDGDTKKYSQTNRQWTLVAPPGKRVMLRIKDFHVKLFTFYFLSIHVLSISLSVATMTESRSPMNLVNMEPFLSKLILLATGPTHR